EIVRVASGKGRRCIAQDGEDDVVAVTAAVGDFQGEVAVGGREDSPFKKVFESVRDGRGAVVAQDGKSLVWREVCDRGYLHNRASQCWRVTGDDGIIGCATAGAI